jgi:KilA-N domain
MSKKNITVQGKNISILEQNDIDYISLTDIAKSGTDREPYEAINSWLRNAGTTNFLAEWERIHNPKFNPSQMARFKLYKDDNRNNITAKIYIEMSGAIGIISKQGKYGGGTFAHKDIAINFCYWLSPEFQVHLIKEYQELKLNEFHLLSSSIPREITKANYGIVTGIVDAYLVGTKTGKAKGLVFASEADIINQAVFGMTAKQWKLANSDKEGNIRDSATTVELQVVSNIEMLHAYLVSNGVDKNQRLNTLSGWAAYLLTELPRFQSTKRIREKADKQKQIKN